MVSLIIFLIALILLIVWIVVYTRNVFLDKEDEENNKSENNSDVFPSLEETIVAKGEEYEVIIISGHKYRVFNSETKEGCKYIIRLKTRDNSPYRMYLSEEQKENIFMGTLN